MTKVVNLKDRKNSVFSIGANKCSFNTIRTVGDVEPLADFVPHSSTHTFSMKAKLRVYTDTWLEDLVIDDKCDCNEPTTDCKFCPNVLRTRKT